MYDNLDTSQRIRSTGKLCKVLGTTPSVLELARASVVGPLTRPRSMSLASFDSELTITPQLHPLFSRSTSNLLPGIEDLSKSASSKLDQRRPPVLKLPPIMPAALSKSIPPSPQSPLSPLAPHIFLQEPETLEPFDSPTAFTWDEIHARRRKMDKLVRYLGENIPCELVFPPSRASTSSEMSTSCCVSAAPAVPPSTRRRRLSVSGTITLSRSASIRSARSNPEIECVVDTTTISQESHPWWKSSTRRRRGRQLDWTGEWNRDDYQNIVSTLRSLKT